MSGISAANVSATSASGFEASTKLSESMKPNSEATESKLSSQSGLSETKDIINSIKNEIPIENIEKSTENLKLNAREYNLKGGAYKDLETKTGFERHHMPAADASKLSVSDGPCIQMETRDHRQTASWGSSREAQEYRAEQKKLIDQGRFDQAFKMDKEDIQEKFNSKYNEAIKDAGNYMESIKKEGKI